MKFTGQTNEFLYLDTIDAGNCHVLTEPLESSLTVLWFLDDDNTIVIDGKTEHFKRNQIVFLTEFHKVTPKNIGRIRMLRFNRPFYCILDHDQTIGCKGILFFGAAQLPILVIPTEEIEKLETLWKMFRLEMSSSDELQIEMLQMMLKRYLILCARYYKQQSHYPNTEKETDLVREFNYLVEQHYHSLHTVKGYAELMFKSPKTISNLFSKMGAKSPLQYIHDRKMLAARRLLHYTDKQIQEIAFEIGFEDIQAFSRFFKKQEGISPSEYKENRI